MPDIGYVAGMLGKVLTVDEGSGTIYCRLLNGSTASMSNLNAVPLAGDIVLMHNEGWVPAPDPTWTDPNSIATVKRVLEDGTVLLDTGVHVRPYSNPREVNVEVNNAVEYNDIDGVIRVVSDTPIRSRDFGLDDADVRSTYLVPESELGLTFDDFGGYPSVIARARELIETQLDKRAKLDAMHVRPVKGILFSGPPGTGKTHLARIIAKESKAEFYLISGPSVVSKWLGDSEETLRRIFDAATASESGRAVVFFDEIDSLAERRSGDSHEASRRVVAQLLTLLDGFDDKGKGVVVIAATNRAEALDPALLRPGRFDWEIEFGLPTIEDRLAILQVGARTKTVLGELPLEDVAALTEGWSAAELTSIWTEAALIAAGDDREAIAAEDLAQAFERVEARPRKTKDEVSTR